MLNITGGVVFLPRNGPTPSSDFTKSLDANGVPYEHLDSREVTSAGLGSTFLMESMLCTQRIQVLLTPQSLSPPCSTRHVPMMPFSERVPVWIVSSQMAMVGLSVMVTPSSSPLPSIEWSLNSPWTGRRVTISPNSLFKAPLLSASCKKSGSWERE